MDFKEGGREVEGGRMEKGEEEDEEQDSGIHEKENEEEE